VAAVVVVAAIFMAVAVVAQADIGHQLQVNLQAAEHQQKIHYLYL
jgi:hypothetical protein